MNSCILMAEIIQDPQLRYTSDNQTPLAEMLVQFPGLRAEDPPATLKVVGWGNLAQEIQERYHQGDRVVIEGRLNMNTIERAEGFKEKRAELTVQRIHSMSGDISSSAASVSGANSSTASLSTAEQEQTYKATSKPARSKASTTASSLSGASSGKSQASPSPAIEPDYDDIPF